jgi:hypothetical protein
MDAPYKLPMPKPGEAEFSDCLCKACLHSIALERGWRPEA